MVNPSDAHYPIYKSLMTHTSWKYMSFKQWYIKKYYNVNDKLQNNYPSNLENNHYNLVIHLEDYHYFNSKFLI
jgi:hypothetical protein